MPRGDGRLTPRPRFRARRAPRTPAASSASGPRARTSPSSPTTGCTRCSTAARSRPASRSATASRSWSTRTWAWSRRSSTSRPLASLQGHLAIGHCRYSTTGASTWENAQPTFRPTADGSIALGHNGNLTNTASCAELVASCRPAASSTATRGELARGHQRHRAGHRAAGRTTPTAPSRSARARACCPRSAARSASSGWTSSTLYAARDPQGIRPLVLGRLERGWVVASETAALDIVGASFVREVEPGEMIAIDEDGLRSQRFAEPARRRAASSSTSTSPARTPRSRAAACTRPGSRWAAGWPASTRSRPTW